jgi:hypothetical protein
LTHEPVDYSLFILPILHHSILEYWKKFSINKCCPAICCHVLSPIHREGGTMREDSLNATDTTPIIAHRGHLLHFLKLFEKNYISLLVWTMYFITILLFSNFIYKKKHQYHFLRNISIYEKQNLFLLQTCIPET